VALARHAFEVVHGDGAGPILAARAAKEPTVSDVLKSRRLAVAAVVLKTLQPYAKSGQAVTSSTDIMADLHMDSLTVMNAVMDIEDHFDISIPLNRLAQFRTVDDLAAYILSILGKY
jgi:acyl carrier protein